MTRGKVKFRHSDAPLRRRVSDVVYGQLVPDARRKQSGGVGGHY